VVKYSPNCILIIVSTRRCHGQAAYKLSKFPRERVIGMAEFRFRPLPRLHRRRTQVSVKNVTAFVLAARRYHGPAAPLSTVAGIPITELIENPARSLVQRTRDGGAES